MYEKSVFLGDAHYPFVDEGVLKITLKFLKWFKPHYVFIVGDWIDFYQLSKFDKNPDRIQDAQLDLNLAKKGLKALRKACPKAKIIYLEGNHEARLRKYLWRHPELFSLDILTIPALLGLKELDIKYVEDFYEFHGFLVEHGTIIRKHSGYSAKAQMEKVGISGISGHSHRLGSHYRTDRQGDFVWYESGCLCKRKDVEYDPHPNWQNGFTVGYFKPNDIRFNVEQVYIGKGKCVYAGKEFTSK